MTQPSTHIPLTLKYRPQTLADLVGQTELKETLGNALQLNKIPHTLMFIGSKGTGKTSTARIFAKSLNCLKQRPTINPCGECESCRKIELGIDIDVTEIDAASNNGVDDARDLIQRIQNRPIHGAYRVVILDECHKLTDAAQNCLLKTFEEPPAHVVFVCCTTDPQKMLGTIIDRHMEFHFHTLSVETISDHLRAIAKCENINISDGALRAIARASEGGPRNAVKTLDKVSLSEGEITETTISEALGDITGTDLLELLLAIRDKNAIGLMLKAQDLLDSGKQPELILTNLLNAFRDLLLIKACESSTLLSTSMGQTDLQDAGNGWSSTQISAQMDQLYRREGQLRYSSNKKLWLEITLLGLIPDFTVPDSADPLRAETSSLEKVWGDTLQSILPESKALLENVRLISLTERFAILKVPSDKMDAVVAKAVPLSRVIAKVSNRPKLEILFE